MTPEAELTRKPLRVDALLLKREYGYQMKSSFGQLLRKYNIVEYKGYGDYLSIDDYYKGLSYTFLYKAEGIIGGKHKVNQIEVSELALLFVCYPSPRKLMKHLRKRNFVKELEKGIYEIGDNEVLIYIVVQSKLQNPEYLWLKNLSDCVSEMDFAHMAEELQNEEDNQLKDELFQFIGENNEALWRGGENVCRIFEEIEERGRQIGEKNGENRLASLIQFLIRDKRYPDIALVSSDAVKRQELYQFYEI